MPTYCYHCNACDEDYEVERAITPSLIIPPRCIYCGAQNTERIFSDVGVQFKGSGFYCTDNRKGEKDGKE